MLQIKGKTLTIIEKHEGRANTRPFNFQSEQLILNENRSNQLKQLSK